MEIQSALLLPRFLRILGDASYSIYLSHVPVIVAIGKLWLIVAIPGRIDNVFIIFIMITGVIAVGIGSYQLLEKPLLSVTRWAGPRAGYVKLRAS